MAISIGDRVRFLDAEGGGIVVRREGNTYYVEDEDGLEYPATEEQLVVAEPEDEADIARTKPRPQPKPQPQRKPAGNQPLVVDLHIEALVRSTAGMSNGEMLQLQLARLRRVMNENRLHKGRRIIFIHGVGTGRLKSEVQRILRREYNTTEVSDASYREYGMGGATMVVI